MLWGITRPHHGSSYGVLSLGTEWKSCPAPHGQCQKLYLAVSKSKIHYLNRCQVSCYVMILVMSRETCEFEFDATVNETDHAFLVIAVQMK
jgi:hypothetical protein